MALVKYEVVRRWSGKQIGDVIEVEEGTLHSALRANVREVRAKGADKAEASVKAKAIVAEATAKAEQIVKAATAEAEKILGDAHEQAAKIAPPK